MSKEELYKEYQKILLKINGGADDYVVALCRISDLIKEFAESQAQQIAESEAEIEIKQATIDYMAKDNELTQDLIFNLQQRLKEKNEETFEFVNKVDVLESEKENLMRTMEEGTEELEDIITHRVCEKIRKDLNKIVEVGDYFDIETDEETNLLKQSDIEKILDQIEKGEK